MMRRLFFTLPLLGLAASGCVARTAWDVATLPVKATGKAIDWTTTSQEESDRNYGRRMRKAEAQEGKERKAFDRECRKHPDTDACRAGYRGYRAGYDR